MKYILISLIFLFNSTAIAGDHSSGYKYPKKDCDELFVGIAELLKEAENNWTLLKNMSDDSNESIKLAEKISWLTSMAADYTTVHEAFCDN